MVLEGNGSLRSRGILNLKSESDERGVGKHRKHRGMGAELRNMYWWGVKIEKI